MEFVNGVHDLGGMQGFGPIVRDEHEPVFHEPWEGRVLAMMRAGVRQGLWTLDEFRWALERMPPASYLRATYYEKWLGAVERLCTERGLISGEELDTRRRALAGHPGRSMPPDDPAVTARILDAPQRAPALPPSAPPRFAAGDAVIVRNIHPRGHTRLPRYVRGKRGAVHRIHGAYALPDAVAAGLGPRPEWVYSVRFAARDLWGPDAGDRDSLHIDLWESYLDRGT
jgi:nitrile hydratase beta subunit